jgi:hypothetical protein
MQHHVNALFGEGLPKFCQTFAQKTLQATGTADGDQQVKQVSGQPAGGDIPGLFYEIFFNLPPGDGREQLWIDIPFGVFERDEAFDGLGFEITHGRVFSRGHIEDRPERDLLTDEIQVVEILPGSARQQGVQFHQGNIFDRSEADLLRFDQRRRQLISVAVEPNADVPGKVDQVPPGRIGQAG